MLKKLLVAFGLALGAMGFGVAATIPNIPSSSQFMEPNQIIGTLNYLIAQLNSLMAGQFVSIPAPITTSGTSANTIFSYSNLVINPGQGVRVMAWGVNDSNADARTVTLNYGSGPTALATVVTGTSAKWWVMCTVSNEGTGASPSIQMMCTGAQAATLITTGEAADTTAGDGTMPQPLSLTATAATAGAMTIDGAWAEYVR